MSLVLEKLSGLSDRHTLKIQRPWFSSDGQRDVTLGVLKQYFGASPADVFAALASNPEAARTAAGAAAAEHAATHEPEGTDPLTSYATKNGEGSNFIVVDVSSSDPLINGANLLAAYAAATALTPNGAAQSATNPAVVFLPPAIYRLPVDTPVNITHPYVHLIGVSPNRDHQRVEGQLSHGLGLGVITVTNASSTQKQHFENITLINVSVNGTTPSGDYDTASAYTPPPVAAGLTHPNSVAFVNVALLIGAGVDTTQPGGSEPVVLGATFVDCLFDGRTGKDSSLYVKAVRCRFLKDAFVAAFVGGAELELEDCYLDDGAISGLLGEFRLVSSVKATRCEFVNSLRRWSLEDSSSSALFESCTITFGGAGGDYPPENLVTGEYRNCTISGSAWFVPGSSADGYALFTNCKINTGAFYEGAWARFVGCLFTANIFTSISSVEAFVFVDCVALHAGTWSTNITGPEFPDEFGPGSRLYNCIKLAGTFGTREFTRLKNCWAVDTLVNDPA